MNRMTLKQWPKPRQEEELKSRQRKVRYYRRRVEANQKWVEALMEELGLSITPICAPTCALDERSEYCESTCESGEVTNGHRATEADS